MVVGMRRTSRVFGVVKSGDGARILRSGRRLYSEPSDVVAKSKKSNSVRAEWLNLLNGDEDRNKAKTAWHGSQVSVKKAEAELEFRNEVCDSVAGLEKNSENKKKIVKVYERKRKRIDLEAERGGSASYGKGYGVGRKFGNHFVRRQQMRKVDIVGSVCRPGLVVTCSSLVGAGLLSRLLNSILAYLMNHEVKLSKLHEFLCSDPIGSVFETRGILFLQKCSGYSGSGYCKIYGVTKCAPLFSVNFSAIPACFMNLYSSMFLISEKLVFTYLVNPTRKTGDEGLDDDNEIVFRIASKDQTVAINGRSPAVNNICEVAHIGIQGGRVRCHRMRLRSCFSSSNIRGKRSAPRSRRRRRTSFGAGFEKSGSFVSSFCLQRTDDASKSLEMPIIDVSCKSMNEGHSIGLLRELDSALGRSSSGLQSSSVSNKWARIDDSSECEQHNGAEKVSSKFDFKSCAASILVIDNDRCYRVEGASVTLELSSTNRWLIAVKKDGFTKYRHTAEMVMKPCTFNRATHNIIWTISDDCKLEFPTREDWSIFKELYKACSSKNLDAPNNNIIPVPGVRIVSNYDDTNTAPYSRPCEYIRLDGNEVSRVFARTSASYDIDSEDEKWLSNYNEETRLQNESQGNISANTLEQSIDAIEKALYFSSGDYLDQRSIADVCAELGNENFIEDVYTYWSKKRKQKRPTLVRVLQAYKPRQVLDAGSSVMRKKRSFKRYSSQSGGGKQRYFFEGESLALMELEEAKALATRYSERATLKRKRAQALMENADLATYKATIAVKIAQAVNDASLPATAASMILI